MDDSDMAGPILFFLLFGTFLLFSGKVHFGYVYGVALLGSISLHIILSLMTPSDGAIPAQAPTYPGQPTDPSSSAAPPSSSGGGPSSASNPTSLSGGPAPGPLSSTLTFPRSASVLGYCLLPLVATSLAGIVVPMDTPLGIVLTAAAILWCVVSSSSMFCAIGRMPRGMRALVAYPLALFYAGFGIMAVFSSRGSGGALARVAAAGA